MSEPSVTDLLESHVKARTDFEARYSPLTQAALQTALDALVEKLVGSELCSIKGTPTADGVEIVVKPIRWIVDADGSYVDQSCLWKILSFKGYLWHVYRADVLDAAHDQEFGTIEEAIVWVQNEHAERISRQIAGIRVTVLPTQEDAST